MNDLTHPSDLELQAHHDGELTVDEAERVAAHCADCATCRTELAELARMDGLLAGIDAPKLPRSVWPDVAAARRGRPRLGPAFGFAAAAACAAGIVIGVLLGPVQFNAEVAMEDTIWTGPSTLLSGGGGTSLLDVYRTDSN